MENQLQFQRRLAALLERAKSQGMRITKEEIQQHFADVGLNEEQMLLVYDYLFSQKVVVAGYLENAKPAHYSPEELEYLRNYERDIKAMQSEVSDDRERLFLEAAAGEAMAKSRLIELYLPVVVEIAKQMHRTGFHIGDMVQEGNVSLLLALDMLADQAWPADADTTESGDQAWPADADTTESGDQAWSAGADTTGWGGKARRADAFLREEIRLGIRAMQEEQEELDRRDRKIEQRVNDLDEALHRAADEKGRAVTLDELAEYVQLSKEEILDIIKLAGEDLYEKFRDSGNA